MKYWRTAASRGRVAERIEECLTAFKTFRLFERSTREVGSKMVNFLLFQILSLIHSIRIERIILFVDSVAPE
jgi:hypothetical protein